MPLFQICFFSSFFLMNHEDQRIVIKFYYLKGYGNKKIFEKLTKVLGELAYCISEIKFWLRRFNIGTKTIMITIFFTGETLVVCDCLPSQWKFNADFLLLILCQKYYMKK